MILYELNDSNLVKVKQIYDYLNSIIQNKDLAAFYYLEDIYINLLTKDWQKIDELMLGFETYKNKTLYQNSTRLIPKLYELTSKMLNKLGRIVLIPLLIRRLKNSSEPFYNTSTKTPQTKNTIKFLPLTKKNLKNQITRISNKGSCPKKN
jgi:hypothetical protein